MSKIALAAALLLASAGAGLADGSTVVMPDPVVVAPVVRWGGFRAGLSHSGHGSGAMTFANPATPTYSFVE